MLRKIQKHLKLILALMILGMSFFACNSASATDLTDAFGALVNSTPSTSYNIQGRGYMMGGGGYIKFPHDDITFVDITPPSFNVGCNGISYFFGGFSFISGAQFTAMLKQFATAALGYAFQIALQTLCPVCMSVLEKLQAAAQLASEFAANACKMSAAMINKAIKSSSTLSSIFTQEGAVAKSINNGETDFLKGITDNEYVQNTVSWLQDKYDYIQKLANGSQDAAKTEANNVPVGNQTWKSLEGLDYYDRVLIQSLTGTVFYYIDKSKQASPLRQTYPEHLSPKDFTNLFMFGVKGTHQGDDLTILDCKEAQGGATSFSLDVFDSGGCTPRPIQIKDSQWYAKSNVTATVGGVNIVNYGFYAAVYAALMQAVYDTEANKSWSVAQNVELPDTLYPNVTINSSFTDAQIKAMVSIAPLPVYQAINIAAINPSVSEGLVQTASVYIAQALSVAYIEQEIFAKIPKIGTQGTPISGMLGDTLKSIENQINQIRSKLNTNLMYALQEIEQQQAWVGELHQVQSILYQTVMENGLADNFAYSSALTAEGQGSTP